MNVGIFGSLNYPQAKDRVSKRLRQMVEDFPGVQFHIITGGDVGVMKAAIEVARRMGMHYSVYQLADPRMRNDCILNAVDRVEVFAVTAGGVAATVYDAISKAVRRCIPCCVWDEEFEPAGEWAAGIV